MKKILIALLSLAMLFSFAACDNSSNTPDDTEEPSGGEGTVTFSDENVKAAWTKVISSFQVNDDATAGFEGAIQDLLGYRSSAYVDLLDSTAVGTGYTVEVSDDYATLTVTRAVSDASAEGVYPAQEAKLVANGIVKTRASESAPVDVVFNDFTYTAKTYATIGDNVVAIDASVSGYFQGKVTAQIVTKNDNKTPDTYTVTADLDAIVLKQNASDFSLALNGETITEGRAFDILGQNFDSVTTFAKNKKTTDNAVKGYVDAYVKQLVANATGSSTDSVLFTALQSIAAADTAKEMTVAYSKDAITVSYTPSTDKLLVNVTDAEQITLGKGSKLDITIAGTGASDDKTFTPTTATISGKFTVSGTSTDTEAKVTEIETTDLAVAVSGTIAVDTTVAKQAVLSGIKIADVSDPDNISGTVSTTIAYGPAIEASTTESAGWALVDGDVTKSYN